MANPAIARRIAILLQSLEGGGSQRRVVELANGFIALGRDVDLILSHSDGELREQVSSAVRIVELDSQPGAASPAEALSEYLRRDPPDAFLSGAAAIHGLAVQAVGKTQRFPLILRASSHPFRGFPWSLPRQRLLEPLRRRARMRRYAAADLIIAVADDIAAAIRRSLPGARISVIANPVVTTSFLAGADAPIELPWSNDPDIPLILGIGRFAVAKDFPTLLRAFALLRAVRPARLAILGDGSARERGALLGLARQLGIESDFTLPGTTDHVAAWLSKARLFVSSSLWEGSAGALIEALAVGCPVVATRSVGSARLLLREGQLGGLVPPRDPRAMASAMAAQLDESPDPVRLMAAAEPYRVDHRAAEYLSAIDDCVRRFES